MNNGQGYGQTSVQQFNPAMVPAPEQTSSGQVSEQVGRLGNHIDSLHGTISALEERLNAVLSPPQPTTSAPGIAPMPSSLAGVVSTKSDAVAAAVDRLQSILARIEL